MSQDFLLRLPSNSSVDVFPNNQMHDFTTKLVKRVDLRGFSVALTEIHYPLTWYDVLPDTYMTLGSTNTVQDRLYITPGKYRTIEKLVDFIQNDTLKDIHDVYTISYNPTTLKVVFYIWRPGFSLQLSPKLAVLLGFKERTFFIAEGPSVNDFVSDSQADINSGMNDLYVYSNIVQDCLVGDTQAPLLRIVPITKQEEGDFQAVEFLHPEYLPCAQETTDLITVNIRRDTGQFVPFKLGKVLVTLHFKKTS